jgi:hypothetical protein
VGVYILNGSFNITANLRPAQNSCVAATYIFFTCSPVFQKLVHLHHLSDFSFIKTKVNELVSHISNFYSHFLQTGATFPASTYAYHQHVYPTDLGPLASLLTNLLKSLAPGNHFKETLFVPIFDFYLKTTSDQTEKSLVEAFHLIITSEYETTKQFKKLEIAVTQALDQTLQNEGNESQKLFEKLDNVLNLIKKIKSAGTSTDLNEDDLSAATNRLISYLVEQGDVELLQFFTSKLYRYNIKINNDVEAAEALVFLTNEYKWDDSSKPMIELGFKIESTNKLKASLLHHALDLFTKSFFYERALDVLNDLKIYYQQHYPRADLLQNLLMKETEILNSKYASERNILNNFYGVRFYSNRFNDDFRDSLYVYRRDGFFRNDEMMSKLQQKFPESTISPQPPSEEVLSKPDHFYIHIFNM